MCCGHLLCVCPLFPLCVMQLGDTSSLVPIVELFIIYYLKPVYALIVSSNKSLRKPSNVLPAESSPSHTRRPELSPINFTGSPDVIETYNTYAVLFHPLLCSSRHHK